MLMAVTILCPRPLRLVVEGRGDLLESVVGVGDYPANQLAVLKVFVRRVHLYVELAAAITELG